VTVALFICNFVVYSVFQIYTDHNTVVDHQKASVKSCGIYVSNIPATDTAEKLTAIFESERLTDIADCSVADVIYDPCDSTCAIVNFTDQQGSPYHRSNYFCTFLFY